MSRKKRSVPGSGEQFTAPHRHLFAFSTRQTLLAAGAIIAACALVYLNSFRGAFLFDDNYNIVENDAIQPFWPPWTWLSGLRGLARPVVTGTFAANYAISGADPWSFHAVNLLIHMGCALTLFGIVRRTLVTDKLRESFGNIATHVAFSIALLWAVHPLQTQAVTYIIQRCESLMSLLVLLTLYGSIRGCFDPAPWRWHVPAVLCCVLATGCKQVAVVAPLLVLLHDVIFLSGSVQVALRRRAFYLGLALSWVSLGVLLAIMPPGDSAGLRADIATPWQYALSQPAVILHYLSLAFWPRTLCLDYLWPVSDPTGAIVPCAIVAMLLAATLLALRRAPAWGFIGAWFFLILAPTSSIMPIKDLAVEHRMYLPLAAVISLLVLGAVALGSKMRARLALLERVRPPVALALVCAVAAPLSYRTVLRNADYATAVGMWERVIAHSPKNARAHYNLGVELDKVKRQAEAKSHYLRALELKPDYADAHNNLGSALLRDGKIDEAIAHIREAIRLKPDLPEAHNNLGSALAKSGQAEQAMAEYREALRLDPKCSGARYNLSDSLARSGRVDDAIAQFQETLRVDPRRKEAWNNLAGAYFNKGQFDDALRCCQEAIAVDTNYAEPHNNAGVILMKLGRLDEAAAAFKRAFKARADYAEAHTNLGNALIRLGKLDDAIAQFKEAVKLDPEMVDAHINIGSVLFQQGQLEAAAATYQDVLKKHPQAIEAHANLGAVLASLGKVADAEAHLKEALRLNPNHVSAKTNLEKLLKQQ